MDNATLQTALGLDPSAYLFNCALAEGRSRKLKTLFPRRSSRLLDLDSIEKTSKSSRYAGKREIALDDIRGTEGRLTDFDNRFNPLTDRTR